MGKKVAFFLPSFDVGGVEQSLINLANALSEKSQVELLVSANKGTLKEHISSNIPIIDLGSGKLRYTLWGVYQYIKSIQPTVLIAGPTFPNFIAIAANWLTGKKTRVIVTHHNFQDKEIKGLGFKGKIIPFLLKFFYERASYVVAVSNAIKDDLIKRYRINPKKVVKIYNLVIDKDFYAKSHAYTIEKYLPPYVQDYVLFIGRLEEIKNCALLLNAFSKLKATLSYPDLHLVVVGDGKERGKLEALSHRLGINTSVHFLGSVANPLPILKAAKLLVNCSFSESMGCVLIEALALQVPVSASTTPGAMEVLKDVSGADIFAMDNIEALCQSMEKMLKFHKENVFAPVEQYTDTFITERYVELIESLS